MIHPQAAQLLLNSTRYGSGALLKYDQHWNCVLHAGSDAASLEELAKPLVPKLEQLEFPALVENGSDLQCHLPAGVRFGVPRGNGNAPTEAIVEAFGFSVAGQRYTFLRRGPITTGSPVAEEVVTECAANQGDNARSLATATWLSTFIHDICQPIGVTQNLVDVILIKLKSQTLDAESLESLKDTLGAATAKTKELITKIKGQFTELDSEPARIDLWELANRHLISVDDRVSFELARKPAAVHAYIQPEQFTALIDCIAELLTVIGAGIVRVSLEEDSTNALLQFDTSMNIDVSPLFEAVGQNLLISALWHSCLGIAKAVGGTIDIVDETRACDSTCTRIQFSIPTAKRERSNRSVKKIW